MFGVSLLPLSFDHPSIDTSLTSIERSSTRTSELAPQIKCRTFGTPDQLGKCLTLRVGKTGKYMTSDERTREIHELDATLRVGKSGIDPVADELRNQLDNETLVKVKFLRSSLGGTTTEELADELAEQASATVVQTRGHTAVFE